MSNTQLNAADAYTALEASYDACDLDQTADLLQRAVTAPIVTSADAGAKARALAAQLADIAQRGDGQVRDLATLAAQLADWVAGVARMSAIVTAGPQDRPLPN
jgi:hypothetical protein